MNKVYGHYLLISFLLICTVLLFSSCGEDDESAILDLAILGITINGVPLVDGTINVAADATVEMSFSNAIDASKFTAAFSVSSVAGVVSPTIISYGSAGSKAIVELELEAASSYDLVLSAGELGQNGEKLAQAITRSFTTRDNGIITSLSPCITASSDCLGSLPITESGGAFGDFTYYTSYPIDLTNARWEELSSAVIVIHGLNRDADNYFSYLMSSLRQENLEGETLLLAPYFKSAADAESGELSWSDASWRVGQNANGGASVSSFTVLDQILDVLSNEERFPALETIIIAGHSSGALFTQTYAAASSAESDYPNLNFHYVVANSQYFYYPADVRYDAGSGGFTTVSGCPAYNHWPLGYQNPPSYLSTVAETTVDRQVVERKIAYFLGDQDIVTTGSLNTSDCEAVLLGENRFRRGEHIFQLMETNYMDTHQTEKIVVPGIGHNGQGMFQSAAFLSWLNEII